MSKTKRLVFGVGINDVDYIINESITIGYIDGKQKQKVIWVCPYYKKWVDLLKRCYSDKYQARYPTYVGCTIDPDWLCLSNFIKWVDSQPNRNWRNCEPDKDLLISGNKHYSPETVAFVTKQVNYFTLSNKGGRGEYMLGVVGITPSGKFRSGCQNPFIKKVKEFRHITELEAHKAWQAQKHEYACMLADLQEDPRVADALRQRYAPDKDWTKE